MVAGQVSSAGGEMVRRARPAASVTAQAQRSTQILAACNCCEGGKEVRRPAVDDAEDPAALLIAGGDKGHAHAGDDPEGDDAEGGTNAVGGDGDAHGVVHDVEAEDGGGDDGEADASIEDEIDAVARDTQHGLADEVKDGAADGRTDDGGVEEGVERTVKPVAAWSACRGLRRVGARGAGRRGDR